jgi:predicted acylesterase/phospholipase RssA
MHTLNRRPNEQQGLAEGGSAARQNHFCRAFPPSDSFSSTIPRVGRKHCNTLLTPQMANFLAKKFSKTAKDLYNIAKQPDRSGDLSYHQQFQPSPGLSHHYYQSGTPQYAVASPSPSSHPQINQTNYGAQQLASGQNQELSTSPLFSTPLQTASRPAGPTDVQHVPIPPSSHSVSPPAPMHTHIGPPMPLFSPQSALAQPSALIPPYDMPTKTPSSPQPSPYITPLERPPRGDYFPNHAQNNPSNWGTAPSQPGTTTVVFNQETKVPVEVLDELPSEPLGGVEPEVSTSGNPHRGERPSSNTELSQHLATSAPSIIHTAPHRPVTRPAASIFPSTADHFVPLNKPSPNSHVASPNVEQAFSAIQVHQHSVPDTSPFPAVLGPSPATNATRDSHIAYNPAQALPPHAKIGSYAAIRASPLPSPAPPVPLSASPNVGLYPSVEHGSSFGASSSSNVLTSPTAQAATPIYATNHETCEGIRSYSYPAPPGYGPQPHSIATFSARAHTTSPPYALQQQNNGGHPMPQSQASPVFGQQSQSSDAGGFQSKQSPSFQTISPQIPEIRPSSATYNQRNANPYSGSGQAVAGTATSQLSLPGPHMQYSANHASPSSIAPYTQAMDAFDMRLMGSALNSVSPGLPVPGFGNQMMQQHSIQGNPPPYSTPNVQIAGGPYSVGSFATTVQTSSAAPPSRLRLKGDQSGSRVRKILSLDGGGVRGYSTLMILDQLMRKLGKQRGEKLHPWEEFDMIAGTSTGGLIAIMLGRLQMSVAECIEAYRDLSSRVFKEARHPANLAGKASDLYRGRGRFEAGPLEQCVKELLVRKNMPEEELLKEECNKDACKVFVCAIQAKNSEAVCIRSYESSDYDTLYDICRVWEAARATSAASTFFPPVQIGPTKQTFVDGALRHNNPIMLVDRESRGE